MGFALIATWLRGTRPHAPVLAAFVLIGEGDGKEQRGYELAESTSIEAKEEARGLSFQAKEPRREGRGLG
jgi:hypothetical protein